MSLYLGTNLISGVATPVEGARNIGQIVQSTIPLTDAGLHLLDGALIQGTGSYADFVDYMAGLVSTYPDLFTTEANWQTAVTTYGVCGKFVYDSVNNTVRLPKITGFTEETTDVMALGDLIEAGLPSLSLYTPNSSEKYGSYPNLVYNTGSTNGNSNGIIMTTPQTDKLYIKDDNNIVGNSSTVQPQAIKVLYYIVIATSTKTQIEVDIDEIATDLNGKADVDFGNINPSATAKANIISWGMPDYSAGIDISSGNISSVYGWFYISGHSYSSTPTVSLNDSVVYTGGYFGSERLSNTCILFVKPNDKISWNGWNAQVSMARIYPCIGVN